MGIILDIKAKMAASDLSREMRALGEFPIDVFPEEFANVVRTQESAMGYPPEYMGSSMLVAFAAAMGNDWSLRVHGDWVEKPLLYMAIVGNAGANKTHPMKFALQPLIDIDLRRIEAARGCEPYVIPPRMVANDVTQEAVVKLHQANPRGLCLFVDELKAWVANFSRYTSGSQEQFWLSNFSRTPIIVDRKSNSEPISIAQPLISVIGSTQPSVLRTFAYGDKASNGFVDRLLFAIRKTSGKSYWNDMTPGEDVSESWSAYVRYIAEQGISFDCVFSPEAKAKAAQWQAMNTDKINRCQDDRLVGGYSKLEIYFVRFCLILHAMRYSCIVVEDKLSVGLKTVEDAMRLVEYYRSQLELAQDLLYPDVEAEMSDKQKRFYKALPDSFSRTEAVRIAKGIGLSQAQAYRHIKQLTGVHIDVAEDGSLCKMDADLKI